ncbi:MgtC/SapB family protein [Ohtaekwangia koreensis]|uniref:Uncharacterized membrane protein, DUF4010 family n=1 Tax=Ohtaekwangia koreensis TaxID=688867 RepID=A0A1T5M620_9BACT|nr:MgtC/SapB family protein [Ohtaekwangia koreensis]SKC83484.1 Uncharacterized membrane protein, DUF4010 family [Ohtaekwangia koreensis]
MPDSIGAFLTPYLLSLIVSTGIGLIIGLEREFRKVSDKDHFAGIRTFPLVCILGCIVTYIGRDISIWIIVAAVIAFIAFIAVTYYVRSTKGHQGITTEISLIITFILGMMTSQELIKESLAATVITTTLLTLKGQFHSFVLKITEDELLAFIKFIVLSLLLYPFLPDRYYGVNGIFNPQETGFIVIVVSSISFVGYLLIKYTGTNKGILLTALLGGIVSSTAVAWTFASRSKKSGPSQSALYAAGITLASSIMYLRVVAVAMIFNRSFAALLILPCATMFILGLIFSLTFIKQNNTTIDAAKPIQLGNPVNILNAFGFGLLYIAIAYLVYYSEKLLGNKGLILSGFISGLADVDAITINIAKLSQDHIARHSAMAVLLATFSNTLMKTLIASLRGTPELRKKVTLAMGSIMATAILFIIFFTLWPDTL